MVLVKSSLPFKRLFVLNFSRVEVYFVKLGELLAFLLDGSGLVFLESGFLLLMLLLGQNVVGLQLADGSLLLSSESIELFSVVVLHLFDSLSLLLNIELKRRLGIRGSGFDLRR